jgi:hypothetical protein
MPGSKKYYSYIIIILMLFVTLISCINFSGEHYGLSKDDYNFITKETIGGKLDYRTTLDSANTYTFNDKQYNYQQMALLMWGSSVRKMGLNNRHDAINLYEEITGVKLTSDERKALLAGFEK